MEIKEIISLGDSHAEFNFKLSGEVTRKSLAAYTMNRVGRDQMDFKEHVGSDGAIVIFCFGEIDIRMHVYNQVQLGRDYKEVLDTLAKDYIRAVVKHKEYSIIPVIMSITPPNKATPGKKPTVGSDEDRSMYCIELNRLLKESCIENHLIFLDVYKHYADVSGLLKTELADDEGHHIGRSEYVTHELHLMLDELRAS